MKINYTIKVNQALEDSFLEHLRDIAAGMGKEDQQEIESVIEHVGRTKPEDWNETARQELMAFLMLRAGFQMGCGYMATEWSDK